VHGQTIADLDLGASALGGRPRRDRFLGKLTAATR
jgi:hypothetical protein